MPDPQELLLAWRMGYDAVARGEANHFLSPQLREAWEQGNLAARSKPVGPQPKSLTELSIEMGLSRARVYQLEKRALHKMRCYARRLAG